MLFSSNQDRQRVVRYLFSAQRAKAQYITASPFGQPALFAV